jgi:short-subunit dehydrogenase
MGLKLKPLNEQVIVITGASSGIGLCTAESAAKQGARVVLAARSENALADAVGRIQAAGGDAFHVHADVSVRCDLQKVAEETLSRFGRIDTWVNNAGTSIYGRLDEVSDEDSRRLFEINFWGVVYGSLVALPYLKQNGGALINVGSEVSEAAVPLLGMYTASKHAVKGFTDSLRIEVEEIDEAPISITLIQPTATDTPFPQHARNYMAEEPKLPNPMIDPQKVADAILDAAVSPTRAAKVGMMSKVNTAMSKLAPGLGEKMAAKQAPNFKSEEKPRDPDGTLYKAGESGHVHGTGPKA